MKRFFVFVIIGVFFLGLVVITRADSIDDQIGQIKNELTSLSVELKNK